MPFPVRRAPYGAIVAASLACACESEPGAQVPSAPVASEQANFRLRQVVSGLEHPWAVAFLPDGDILITERPGRLRIVRGGVLDPTPIDNVPEVYAEGQGGLLDIALHPDSEQNRLLYLSYAARGEGGAGTRVTVARLRSEALEDLRVIFEVRPFADGDHHFGSRLALSPDGLLYVTLGERRNGDRAQDLSDLAGKTVRLLPDGRVPDHNPFVGRREAAPQIFSYGHRNPQGIAVHPETGEIWTHEHGPRGGDEINVIRPGVNYGWPVITYGISYMFLPIGEGTQKEGMAQPVYVWTPSIAPSGMAFYRDDAFPEWRGDLFVGALAAELLVRIELDGEQVVAEERLLEGTIGRIRDVALGPEGFVYLLTDEADGGLWRLEPVL